MTRKMMMLGLLVACGCADSNAPYVPPGTTPDEPEPMVQDEHVHEYVGLSSNQEIQAAAEAGVVRFDAGGPFLAARVEISSLQRYELEYAVVLADGTKTEFGPLELVEPEYTSTVADVFLEAEAIALDVRIVEGSGSLDHLGVRFFQEIPADGVLFTHDDEPPVDQTDPEAMGLGFLTTRPQALARPGRYIPPASVIEAGRRQSLRYEGAPAWSRSNCGGSLLQGTRTLAEDLRRRFPQITHYGGYSCRANTASPGRMSVHGTGRALDLHIRLSGGDADNDQGDAVANWLIENAEAIGVQYIIWDRTSWGGHRSGDKHRRYGGPHPHHDHLHIELTSAGGRMQTPYFGNPSNVTMPDPTSPATNEGTTCRSSTLGRRVDAGACVQMSYVQYGGRCNWAVCGQNGRWSEQRDPNACPGDSNANASCGSTNQPAPQPAPTMGRACFSRTLDRSVSDGEFVQVNYKGSSCEKCGHYRCDDGSWTCDAPADGATTHSHAECQSASPDGPQAPLSITLEWDEPVDLDLYIQEPSGATLNYSTNATTANDGYFDNEGSCRGSDCGSAQAPYREVGFWGLNTSQAVGGTYTFWIRNYSGRSAANARVTVVERDGMEVKREESFMLSLPAQRGAETSKQTFEVEGGEMPAPGPVGGDAIGTLWHTYYYLSNEANFSGTANTKLFDSSCRAIATVSSKFSDSICIEGSGKLADGSVLNYAKTCSCGRRCPTGGIICYSKLDASRFPWGKGSRSNPLRPLRSIAVDPARIPHGTKLYLDKWDGVQIPSVDGIGGFTHDGCFEAADVGGAIKGNHIDVFAGTSGMRRALERILPTRTSSKAFKNSPRCR